MKRLESFVTLMAVLLLTISADLNAQERRFDDVQIRPQKVTNNIYLLEGDGGNIGLFFGEDGAFLIDSQYAPLSNRIVAAVRELTNAEIRFLVNTHVHGDHVGGNGNFSGMGAVIVAHDNVRRRMVEGPANLILGKNDPPSAKAALPIVTMGDEINLHLNGERVNLFSVGPAHTDGDIFIHFTESNVMHLGDVFRTTTYPVIDLGNGGNFHGTIDALKAVAERADENTKIIPGHGEISNKADVQSAIEMYEEILEGVRTLKNGGKSLPEVIAANPGAEYDKRWEGEGEFGGKEVLLQRIYRELPH